MVCQTSRLHGCGRGVTGPRQTSNPRQLWSLAATALNVATGKDLRSDGSQDLHCRHSSWPMPFLPGIPDNEFYVIPYPEVRDRLEQQFAQIVNSVAGLDYDPEGRGSDPKPWRLGPPIAGALSRTLIAGDHDNARAGWRVVPASACSRSSPSALSQVKHERDERCSARGQILPLHTPDDCTLRERTLSIYTTV